MNAAAIKGTYSDYRRVKGRKVLQLIVEVPLEQAPQVHKAFGEPSPDGSTWVAVARLDAEKSEQPQPDKKEDKHKLSRQAAMLCGDTQFQNFLKHKHSIAWEQYLPHGSYDVVAAMCVRTICLVRSRSAFDAEPDAAARWRDLKASFEAWRLA